MPVVIPSKMIGSLFALMVIIFANHALSQTRPLPSTEEFMNVLTVCGAGAGIKIDADIQGSIRSIYSKERTQGTAAQEIVAKVIDQFPPGDRLRAFELYINCISTTLGSINTLPRGNSGIPLLKPAPLAKAINTADEYIVNLPERTDTDRRIARAARSCLAGLKANATQEYFNINCRNRTFPEELSGLFSYIHELNYR